MLNHSNQKIDGKTCKRRTRPGMVSWDKNLFFSLSHTHKLVYTLIALCVCVCVCVSASIVLYMTGCLVVVLFVFAIKQEAFLI